MSDIRVKVKRISDGPACEYADCGNKPRYLYGHWVCVECFPLLTSEVVDNVGKEFRKMGKLVKIELKAQYDKYIYPIIAPPAIAIVKLMTRLVNWMIDNMGEKYE